jgi:hypothetical protein
VAKRRRRKNKSVRTYKDFGGSGRRVDGGLSASAAASGSGAAADPNSTFRKRAMSKKARELRANAALARLEKATPPTALEKKEEASESSSETEVEDAFAEGEEDAGFLVEDFFDFRDDEDDGEQQKEEEDDGCDGHAIGSSSSTQAADTTKVKKEKEGEEVKPRLAKTKASNETPDQRRARLEKGIKPEERSDFLAGWNDWLSSTPTTTGRQDSRRDDSHPDNNKVDDNSGLLILEDSSDSEFYDGSASPNKKKKRNTLSGQQTRPVKTAGSNLGLVDLTSDLPPPRPPNWRANVNEWCVFPSDKPFACPPPPLVWFRTDLL